ncbi:MAG TPA: hypothetical protein VFK89_09225 [Actinomycetota bacterium]|nr:hypothetical protein [Actinomycetota bacterium]
MTPGTMTPGTMTPGTMTLAHSGSGVALKYGTDWLYPLVPLLVVAAVVVYLIATGKKGADRAVIGIWSRAGHSLERETGLPAWSAGALGIGGAALLIAVVGFMWDVAWHIDFGRDKFLFTPAHTMIVVGLGMLGAAAVVSVIFATRERADVGIKLGRLRIPYGALALGALGFGALCGFPLDDLWHGAYGVDVTMWGPTHLLMIGGASFSPLALWLLLAEAGPDVTPTKLLAIRRVALAGAVVIGLSTFQGEFDFGVPQFQQLYHPVLIALAASVGLVAAREALGRWGALKAAVAFIVLRAGVALIVGPVLNHVVPHFPLYLGAAVMVELAASLTEGSTTLRRIAAEAAGVGIVGVAAEWLWTLAWGWHPWGSSLFPGVIVAVAIALPGAAIGTAIGRTLTYRRVEIGGRWLLAAGVAIVVLLALPFPRNDAPIQATISTDETSPQAVTVRVETDRALPQADWFEVLSWQGDSMKDTPLVRTSLRTYETEESVPVGGDWKTLVRYARKDVMVAAPVYMPADPSVGAKEVPAVPERTVELQRDTDLLLREAHGGPAWVAVVAYTGIAIVALSWFALLALAFARIGARFSSGGGRTATETRSGAAMRPAAGGAPGVTARR